jgi:hypothetical protein
LAASAADRAPVISSHGRDQARRNGGDHDSPKRIVFAALRRKHTHGRHLSDLGWNIDPRWPGLTRSFPIADRIAPSTHRCIHLLQGRQPLEARMKRGSERPQSTGAAGNHEQPSSISKNWSEASQHLRGAEIVRRYISVNDGGRIILRIRPVVMIREDDVDPAVSTRQLGGKIRHRPSTRNIQLRRLDSRSRIDNLRDAVEYPSRIATG